MKSSPKAMTSLEALRDSLVAAGRYNPDDVAPPVAILWTDPDRQWEGIIPQLQVPMRQLLVLGDYDPARRTGPAIWLRCAIERTLPDLDLPEDVTPVLYLPEVSRQTLRAARECPDALKPLVELQYRGTCWTQKNGRDWTVEAFLVSKDGGLGLDVARDATTRASMMNALPDILAEPVARFMGRRLEAEDFDKLLVNPEKDLLTWLNNPKGTRETWTADKWKAFKSRCKAELRFDPDKDGPLVGGEFLGGKQGAWEVVWDRFEESPALYPGIHDLLRKSMPAQRGTYDGGSSWPQINEGMEDGLRKQLLQLEDAPASEVQKKIFDLEKAHGQRRDWVWSRLGKAPLARALKPLQTLARRTQNTLGGASLESMQKLYVDEAWEADAAALDALKEVKSLADWQAVQAAIRGVYLPWLQSGAAHFQKLLEKEPLPTSHEAGESFVEPEKGCVMLFVDGLRWDLAKRLVDGLHLRGYRAELTTRWAGLPTVTATTKATGSPIVKELQGDNPGEDFLPNVASTGQSLNPGRFRKLLESREIQILDSGEVGEPTGSAWTEQGDLDRLGHTLQAKLAHRVDEQLELIHERVDAFIEAGWKEVLVVTDHGWLLMPGGLPAITLPKYLTETRWARCASVKGESKVECPIFPWFWNPNQYVAVAPGISCFGNGFEYAHGGASLQECLVPIIVIKAPSNATRSAAVITEVKWAGLRCRVKVEPAEKGLKVDIRTKANDPDSSQAQGKTAKSVNEDGMATLFVDDEQEGLSVLIVLLDDEDVVIGKQATIIGGGD